VISYVLLAAALLLLAALVSRVVFRRDRRDDTERFNRAREVTTTWARQHESGGTPYPAEPAEQTDDVPESADPRR
jgi:hypothetical protein